jgi:hypothetical protein
MTFTPNMPLPPQTLGQTQSLVLNNFASLRQGISNTAAGKPNHVDVNGGSTAAGKHIFIQMPVQTPGAPNLTLSNEVGLISQTTAGSSELYFNRDGQNNAGTPRYRQMTGPTFFNQGDNSVGGTSIIFDGLVFKWGYVNLSGGSTTVSFATQCGSAFTTTCYSVILSGNTGFNASNYGTLTASSFIINGGNGYKVYFIALGY